ncbi:hypothetical protein P4U43_00450 [Arthrobacter sp. EH-1B-1]|uniref:Uncharacterized protein n=1 Tax=Arthrobacter vasquezii TaxID=2977629 RepID=A0ABT6CQ29_9MICC|nr:hypothetical protein [Arthrobacter vasquezii]MDF9276258.1 hypothetical protein [Arthrobacter vasquezii]
MAHVDVVPERKLADALQNDAVRFVPVQDLVAGNPKLQFDHPIILAKALAYVRAAYAEHPDPDELMRVPFTLRELKETGEKSDGGCRGLSRLFARN